MRVFWETYFDFHYGIGIIIGVTIFSSYVYMINKRELKQGGKISLREVFLGLALSVYLVFLFGVTLLNRTSGEGQGAQLELFWSYRKIYQNHSKALMRQILYNMLAFVPWGILIPLCFENVRCFWKVAGSAVMVSMFIEITQFVGQCGLCELDDVVHNSVGSMIGYGIYRGISCFLSATREI